MGELCFENNCPDFCLNLSTAKDMFLLSYTSSHVSVYRFIDDLLVLSRNLVLYPIRE